MFTDNNPLTYILSTTKLYAMGHSWVSSLGPYNFKLHYKPGKLNADVNSLSRIDWKTVEPMQRKTTMDLARVDRTLILDPEIRGRVAVDSVNHCASEMISKQTTFYLTRSMRLCFSPHYGPLSRSK